MIRNATYGALLTVLAGAGGLGAQDVTPPASPPVVAASPPAFLHDRGSGVPTSMFGTYIRRGELIVYPFFEYYKDDDFEYKPEELGYPGDVDSRGRYRASEGLLFLGYGLTDDLALEAEAAVIDASLEKSPSDTSSLPSRIEESGLGDVEAQLRWRFARESESRPEYFTYFETVFPQDSDKVLIGTPGWELKLGVGLVKGFRWGTLSARLAIDYEEESSSSFDIGEYAIEYLKRLSPRWRIYLGVEGTQDEVELITEVQWHLTRNVFLKLNSGFGITSKATDWAPEVGLLFTLPTRRTPR